MRRFLFLFAAALSAATAAAQHRHEDFSGNTDTVFVQGLVSKPFFLLAGAPGDLKPLPVPPQKLVNGDGETRHRFGASKGILLSDLIQKAAPDVPHRDRGRYFVVVTAADGLQVIFAYNELLYGPAAKDAYLLVADGVRGLEGAGRFAVLCSSDRATTPRYVKWVRSIELRKI